MQVIRQMLSRYPKEQHADAMREVMQEIALAGLQRGGFFQKAAFYGGTCLRIFYSLPRFSEDLDFSLLQPERDFSLKNFFPALREEFAAFGFDVDIEQRQKSIDSPIVSAFLKKDTSIYDVRITGQKIIKIKFEVDTNPPGIFCTEDKLLIQPYSFYVKCFCLKDLFAGKIHALLFRRWNKRIKGRDWFDFEWYIRQGTSINLEHLEVRARQSNDWTGGLLSLEAVKDILIKRISCIDWEQAKADIRPFITNLSVLDIWSAQYFTELVARL